MTGVTLLPALSNPCNSYSGQQNVMYFSVDPTVATLHLKSLPCDTEKERISSFFKDQGKHAEVLSFEAVGINEVLVSVAGLTDEGNSEVKGYLSFEEVCIY